VKDGGVVCCYVGSEFVGYFGFILGFDFGLIGVIL